MRNSEQGGEGVGWMYLREVPGFIGFRKIPHRAPFLRWRHVGKLVVDRECHTASAHSPYLVHALGVDCVASADEGDEHSWILVSDSHHEGSLAVLRPPPNHNHT